MTIEIAIDREVCMGSGNCSFWAPGVFDLDDDGVAIVIDPDGAPEDKIILAAQGCPDPGDLARPKTARSSSRSSRTPGARARTQADRGRTRSVGPDGPHEPAPPHGPQPDRVRDERRRVAGQLRDRRAAVPLRRPQAAPGDPLRQLGRLDHRGEARRGRRPGDRPAGDRRGRGRSGAGCATTTTCGSRSRGSRSCGRRPTGPPSCVAARRRTAPRGARRASCSACSPRSCATRPRPTGRSTRSARRCARVRCSAWRRCATWSRRTSIPSGSRRRGSSCASARSGSRAGSCATSPSTASC